MSFEKLIGVLGDNEEAKKIASELQVNFESLTREVNRLELVSNEAIEKRNKIKSVVKGTLGVDEITEESLKALISSSKGDDKSKAEIENLQRQIAEIAKSKQDVELAYKQKIQSMNLEREIASLGIEDEVIPTKLDYLNFRVKSGLSFTEDGQPIFLNEDGSTKYVNGKPMTLKDRYSEILEKEPDLFKPSTKSGTGHESKGGPSGKSFKDMSEQEKVALYRRNPDEYRRLASN